MTTGRINQVIAFHCARSASSRGSSCANSNHAPCMKAQDGTCPPRPKGTALVTALGLDFALLRTEQPLPFAIPSHTQSLCTVNQFEGMVPATAATNSSLGRLADPGLDRWHSTLLPCAREITGTTSLQPCLAPVPHKAGHTVSGVVSLESPAGEPSLAKPPAHCLAANRQLVVGQHLQGVSLSRAGRCLESPSHSPVAVVCLPCVNRGLLNQRLAEPPAHCLPA